MRDSDCVAFLQWALPRIGKRWPGFRKVRRQVCRRIRDRMVELGIGTVEAYRERLETEPEEWDVLDRLCRVTISRFFRDRGVWSRLDRETIPDLLSSATSRSEDTLRVWSAGCASGEEPSSLSLAWELGSGDRRSEIGLVIVATDVDEAVLDRAEAGRYRTSSLRELPSEWRERAFRREGDAWVLRERFRDRIRYRRADVSSIPPEAPFHLVLCRNLVYTYFAEERQSEATERFGRAMTPGGVLVVGSHESLPPGATGFSSLEGESGFYRRETGEEGGGTR